MDEFDLIRRYFERSHDARSVRIGIGDDGAVLMPAAGREQIQVIDTLVSDVHFPNDTDPRDIAFRAVAVNLSDVAAMGGTPRWMTLALTLCEASPDWLQSFSSGLFAAADQHDVTLIGGDTTRGETLTVTVAMTADVEVGEALLRNGANVGDSVFVTGSLGDAAAGLALLQRGAADDYLSARFLRPTARVSTGQALLGLASAAIDISDGLVGDLKKLLAASGVGAAINIEQLPLSEQMCARFDESEQLEFALKGGDDYELCFTAPADAVAHIGGITKIGTVTASPQLEFRHHDRVVDVIDSGYRHFQ